MFYFLSKTLDYFLYPISWIFILLLLSILLRKWRKTLLVVACILLYFFGNPYLANKVMKSWEQPPKNWCDLPSSKSLGIILTGVVNPLKSPKDRVYMNKGADRVLHTIELYRRDKIDSILISGNYTRLTGEVFSEAQQLKHVLVNAGVPDSIIFLEERSKNTYENALYSSGWITSNKLEKPILLITSAFHMNRAEACFEKQGIDVIPFPVDFYSRDSEFHPLMLLPSQASITTFSVLIHELVGFYVYKVRGYL